MTDDARRTKLAPHVHALEAELRRLGWWQSQPPTPEQLAFQRPFAMDTMAFSQWLQFVFLPIARDMLAGTRTLPPSSSLAPHAVRELDGVDDARELEAILRRIDDAVNGG
ncbi:MAG TPA: YqcC family protein [Xanthomonadales bacterium]|nr:YqcC family protein [Xanthomonadales bacterium]